MTNNFLYKHCAECGKRIPHTEIRCNEHAKDSFGKARVVRISDKIKGLAGHKVIDKIREKKTINL